MRRALEDVARNGVHADRAAVAMDLLHAVRGPLAGEIVPLHDAGGAAALGDAGDVDRLDLGEDVDLRVPGRPEALDRAAEFADEPLAARNRPWRAGSTPAAARRFCRLLSSLATWPRSARLARRRGLSR